MLRSPTEVRGARSQNLRFQNIGRLGDDGTARHGTSPAQLRGCSCSGHALASCHPLSRSLFVSAPDTFCSESRTCLGFCFGCCVRLYFLPIALFSPTTHLDWITADKNMDERVLCIGNWHRSRHVNRLGVLHLHVYLPNFIGDFLTIIIFAPSRTLSVGICPKSFLRIAVPSTLASQLHRTKTDAGRLTRHRFLPAQLVSCKTPLVAERIRSSFMIATSQRL